MKAKSLIAILVLTLTISTAHARDEYTRSTGNYAGRGALVGLIVGGTLGGGMGLVIADEFSDVSGESTTGPSASSLAKGSVTGLLVGGALGAGVGALIGSGIKKKHNYAIAPILDPDPKAPGAGVNLSLKF